IAYLLPDLTLKFYQQKDESFISFSYIANSVNEELAEDFLENFVLLLNAALYFPEEKLKSIKLGPPSLPLPSEKRTPSFPSLTILELFKQHTEKSPSKVAITYNSSSITYKQLDEMSDAIAYTLLKQGIKKNDPIGLL